MESKKENLISLFKDKYFANLENQIVEKVDCELYREDLPLLAEISSKEIENSDFLLEDIILYAKKNGDIILEFSKMFLAGLNIKSLSSGISLSYSIYLMYLTNKKETDLLNYLDKLRVKDSQKTLVKLIQIKADLKI